MVPSIKAECGIIHLPELLEKLRISDTKTWQRHKAIRFLIGGCYKIFLLANDSLTHRTGWILALDRFSGRGNQEPDTVVALAIRVARDGILVGVV